MRRAVLTCQSDAPDNLHAICESADHIRRSVATGVVFAPGQSAPAVSGSKGVQMKVTACPFCGVATDVPHEKQELCIAALHGEIARMRDLVRRVKDPPRPQDLVSIAGKRDEAPRLRES
jgi:hypothetical protein